MSENWKQLLLWLFSHRGKKNGTIWHLKYPLRSNFKTMNIVKLHQCFSKFFGVIPPTPHYVLSTTIGHSYHTFKYFIYPIIQIRLLNHDNDLKVHFKSKRTPPYKILAKGLLLPSSFMFGSLYIYCMSVSLPLSIFVNLLALWSCNNHVNKVLLYGHIHFLRRFAASRSEMTNGVDIL